MNNRREGGDLEKELQKIYFILPMCRVSICYICYNMACESHTFYFERLLVLCLIDTFPFEFRCSIGKSLSSGVQKTKASLRGRVCIQPLTFDLRTLPALMVNDKPQLFCPKSSNIACLVIRCVNVTPMK